MARKGRSSRREIAADVSAVLLAKYVRPAETKTTKHIREASIPGPTNVAWISDATIRGRTTPAWLYKEPYHGIPPEPCRTRPLTSRHSVTPIRPTTTAAKGPPRAAAAKSGAIVTLTTAPPGILTGEPLLSTVISSQNANPG